MKNSRRRLGFIRLTDFLFRKNALFSATTFENCKFLWDTTYAQKFTYGSQRAMLEFGKVRLLFLLSQWLVEPTRDAGQQIASRESRLSTGSNQALLLITEIRKCAFLVVVGIEGNVERHHARTQREK